MEEVMIELEIKEEEQQGLPPGFRFHPTDEELITYYLTSKLFQPSAFSGAVHIPEVDLNRCEPWDLPDEAKMGEREWYFFSLRDRKYPTGLRTNRATGAGYWKATGKDREVYSSSSTGGGGGALLIGMKKTLVFYKGRAPRGLKTKWVMHEYRLDSDFSNYRHTCKEEWVICRIFNKSGEKRSPNFQGPCHVVENTSSSSPTLNSLPSLLDTTPLHYSDLQTLFQIHHHQFKTFTNSVPSSSQSHLSFPMNTFYNQSSFSTIPTTIPRQCKTESNFSNCQLAANSNIWQMQLMDKIERDPFFHYQNPLFFEIGGSNSNVLLGYSSTDADAAVFHDMSTSSVAFNRSGFQISQLHDICGL